MHWSRISEAGFDGGIRFLFAVHRVLGRWPFRIALYPVLAWMLLVRSGFRRASLEYLARLHAFSGGATPRASPRQAARHFAAFAETLLDKLLVWSGRLDELAWDIEEDGIVARLLHEARGAVIVTSHIGNLELCRVLSRRHGAIGLSVLVHTRHTPNFDRLMRQLAPEGHVQLLQVADLDAPTAMRLAERVGRGEFLAIAGDRVPLGDSGRTLPVEFLGATAQLPLGPYVLAHALRCPLLMLTVSRRDNGRHRIALDTLAERVELPRGNRDAGARDLAQRYARRLEVECVAAPLQWFNFFPFWAPPAGPAGVRQPEAT